MGHERRKPVHQLRGVRRVGCVRSADTRVQPRQRWRLGCKCRCTRGRGQQRPYGWRDSRMERRRTRLASSRSRRGGRGCRTRRQLHRDLAAARRRRSRWLRLDADRRRLPIVGALAGPLHPLPPLQDDCGRVPTPDDGGYWVAGTNGEVSHYGDAGFFRRCWQSAPQRADLGMATTPDGKGYWLVGSDGGIFNFGDAGFFSLSGTSA